MRHSISAAVACVGLGIGLGLNAAEPAAKAPAAAPVNAVAAVDPKLTNQQLHDQSVAKALEFLRNKGQLPDGSYSKQAGPAVTALVTAGVLRSGVSPKDPLAAKSLAYLEKYVQPDGGIYTPDGKIKNYETCLAILCFAEANQDGKYAALLKKADAFIKGMQWDGDEGHDKSSVNYGGAGYGKAGRPDLSNTQFLVEALRAAGNSPEDESLQKALVFVSRCQNLESPANTTPFAAKVNDGGFYYTPANGGESQAGKNDDGGLRSYASMTYAGLKSMIFAGVKADDPRVKAAVAWSEKHYNIKENPGMGSAGLFYYYHTMAKALDAMNVDEVKDAQGKAHDWRRELLVEFQGLQKSDGSWTNENSRWMEGDANLVTGYGLLTLSHLKPKAAR